MEMNPTVEKAQEMIRARDVHSVAYGGGAILQELGIRDPAHWAGGATKLGKMIREEVFNEQGNLKQKYVIAGNNLTKNTKIGVQADLLSSLILRVAAVNLVTTK